MFGESRRSAVEIRLSDDEVRRIKAMKHDELVASAQTQDLEHFPIR